MLVLYSQYHSWIKNVIDSARKIRKFYKMTQKLIRVRAALTTFNGYSIGQEVKVYFVDEFYCNIKDLGTKFYEAAGVYEIETHVIDILKNGDNFAILAYPVKRDNMFGIPMNPFIKEVFGVDNMQFPLKACLFAEYNKELKTFFVKGECKRTSYMGLESQLFLPKIFNIPMVTLKKLRILVETNTIAFRLPNCHPHWYTFNYDEYLRQIDLQSKKRLKS